MNCEKITIEAKTTNKFYSAEGLYRFMTGYAPGDEVEIELDPKLGKIIVCAMYGEWKYLRSSGERFEEVLEKLGMDKEYYYYFLVGSKAIIESDDWTGAVFYTDSETFNLCSQYKIESGMRIMPKKVYDLAWEATKNYFEKTG